MGGSWLGREDGPISIPEIREYRRPSIHPPQRGGGCRSERTQRPASGGQDRDPTRAPASAPGQGRSGRGEGEIRGHEEMEIW